MSEILVLALFGFYQIALDAILWGTFGYLVFKIYRGKDKNWLIGALLTFVAYFVLIELVTTNVLQAVNIGFSQDVTEFLGDSWKSVDIFTVIIDLVSITIGFKIGQYIVNKTLPNIKKLRR